MAADKILIERLKGRVASIERCLVILEPLFPKTVVVKELQMTVLVLNEICQKEREKWVL